MFELLRDPFGNKRASELQQELDEKSRSFDEIIAMLDDQHKAGSATGIYITVNRAMRQSTVWACARIISEIIATLPVAAQTRQNGSWVTAEQHDAIELLDEPNEWQTKHDLVSFLVLWSELRGNGYALKIRARGKVRRLIPIEADDVTAEMSPDWLLRYHISRLIDGSNMVPDKVFHLRNFGTESHVGLSTVGNHRDGIGLAIQLEEHAASAYKNGLQTSKWIHSEKNLTGEPLEALKKAVREFQGSKNAGKIPIFSGGIKLEESNGISAQDAQYIESRKMQKQDIAAIFGVPLFLLNDTEKSTTWGTGLEQLSRAFVRFSLKPRLNRLAQTFLRELASNDRRSTRFVFDTDEFTLGEFKDRMEGYKTGIESGVINPDEAREIEGRNPREDGKGSEYRKPMNVETESESEQSEDEGGPAVIEVDE